MGHPLGVSGAGLLTTATYPLHRTGDCHALHRVQQCWAPGADRDRLRRVRLFAVFAPGLAAAGSCASAAALYNRNAGGGVQPQDHGGQAIYGEDGGGVLRC